jgi:hypothetical protein
MIAAGVNAKALSTCLGHSNISVTYDRYGHLTPGSSQRPRRSPMPTWSSPTPRRDWRREMADRVKGRAKDSTFFAKTLPITASEA